MPSWPSPQKKSGFIAPPPFVAKVRRTRAREFKNYSLNPCAPLFSNFSYDDFLLDQFRLELASRGVVTEASSARFSFSTAQRKWNAAADHHATAPRRADLALAQLSAASVFENAAKTERGRRMALRRVRFRAITRGDVAFRRRRCDSHSSRIFHLRARPLDAISVSVSVSGGAEKMERGRRVARQCPRREDRDRGEGRTGLAPRRLDEERRMNPAATLRRMGSAIVDAGTVVSLFCLVHGEAIEVGNVQYDTYFRVGGSQNKTNLFAFQSIITIFLPLLSASNIDIRYENTKMIISSKT